MKSEQLKIVFKNGVKTIEVIWKIVGHRKNLVLLESEFGPFWANDDCNLFKKGELVINVESELSEKFAELIRWIGYQFTGINNLYVLIEPNISNNTSTSSANKVMECKYDFMRQEWSTELNLWVVNVVEEKLTYLPKSEIKLLPCGKSVVPVWLITKNLPVSFSKTVECIRLIKKSDLINMINSHRNNLVSTSS